MSEALEDLLLVIDVGNTNSVLGLYRGDQLEVTWRIASVPRATDELGVLLLGLFSARQIPPSAVTRAICASVVPPTIHATRRACQRYFGVEPVFVGDLDIGVEVNYHNPSEVGADRLVNAVAAYEQHRSACVVVDFGTATTFDVVGPDGAYEGGVIAPGLNVSLDALVERTAKLPRVEIAEPPAVIGRTTVGSMQAGIFYGYVGLVDGITERIITELGCDPVHVLATGGLAGLIGRESRLIEHIEPFLTLEGLRLCYERSLETSG